MKRNEDNLTDLWDNVKCSNFHIIGVPEEDRKAMRKYLRKYQLKTSLKWEWNSHRNPRNPESHKQDKPKVKRPKTHTNQIIEIKHKKQILKANC